MTFIQEMAKGSTITLHFTGAFHQKGSPTSLQIQDTNAAASRRLTTSVNCCSSLTACIDATNQLKAQRRIYVLPGFSLQDVLTGKVRAVVREQGENTIFSEASCAVKDDVSGVQAAGIRGARYCLLPSVSGWGLVNYNLPPGLSPCD